MKILLTGANGFLGKGIASELVRRGHIVTAAVISGEGLADVNNVVPGDIFNVDSPREAYGDFEIVVHLAWRDGFNHSSKHHIDDLPSHCRFIDRCINERPLKIVAMGSMHEIGYYEGAVRSDTPCMPMSAYGIAKNALRDYCFMAARDTNCCIQWLRGFYIVTNDPTGESIFSKVVMSAREGNKSFPFTSGKNMYDFLEYDDYCSLTADIVESDCVSGVYNVASGVPETLASRIERFIIENSLDIQLDYGRYPDRPYDSPAIWGDMSATEALILRNKTQLERSGAVNG